MNEIVVGYDGRAASEPALEWAADEAERRGRPLYVLCAWDLVAAAGPFTFQVEKERRELARELVDKAGERISQRHRGVEVRTAVTVGPAAPALLEASETAELLVVGTRSRGAVTGLLLGSVNLHCITHASCPVVVVPGDRVAP